MRAKAAMKFLIWSVLAIIPSVQALAAPVPDSFADLAARLKPSVVNISSVKVIKGHSPGFPFGDFFGRDFNRRFGGPPDNGDEQEFRSPSLGSGFIWDTQGYIVTNNHVIKDADEVKVILEGGKEFDAKVIGGDSDTDVALIKIEPGDAQLKPVKRGDSNAIRVGDWVLAIGNPFGYGHTVTAGIISAKERVIGSGPYDDFLQTDAAINPGNSGGPLFDMNGGVVGINSAKIEGASSIGFAIPINMASQVIDELKGNDGKVSRGWLGVSIQEVTQDTAKALGLKRARGALVGQVFQDSPAEKAGIKRGDVILSFDGKEIERSSQLPYMVGSHKPNSNVELEVFRDGDVKKLSVHLATKDPKRQAPAEGGSGSAKKVGVTVQEITPELRRAMGLDADRGVVVTEVEPRSPAAKAGLRRGDVIIEVNRTEIKGIEEFNRAVKDFDKKETTLVAIERGGSTSYLVLRNEDKDKK